MTINGGQLYIEELGAGSRQAILCFHAALDVGDHRDPTLQTETIDSANRNNRP